MMPGIGWMVLMGVGLVIGLGLVIAVARRLRSRADLGPEAALAWARQGGVLVDVRSPLERRWSAVPNSVHAPWRQVVAALQAQGIGPSRPVLLYCMAGPRARYAANRLRAAGYLTVLELAGGHRALMRRARASHPQP